MFLPRDKNIFPKRIVYKLVWQGYYTADCVIMQVFCCDPPGTSVYLTVPYRQQLSLRGGRPPDVAISRQNPASTLDRKQTHCLPGDSHGQPSCPRNDKRGKPVPYIHKKRLALRQAFLFTYVFRSLYNIGQTGSNCALHISHKSTSHHSDCPKLY